MKAWAAPRRALATALGIGWLLAGCAALQPPPPAGSLLAGRLSLQLAADGSQPQRAFSGQFELRGDATAGALEVAGPLGATVLQARWADGIYRLDDGRGEQRFDTLEDLSRSLLGEPLPLAALFDWLRQRPWPGAPHRPRPDGRPGFEQLGWIVDLQESTAGLLRAERPAPPALSLRVRLDRGGET